MARLLTFEELKDTHGVDVWEEFFDGIGTFRCGVTVLRDTHCLRIEYREPGMHWCRISLLTGTDLGNTNTALARYWDSRPTELERRVATWRRH